MRPTFQMPEIDLSRVLAGDWLGAIRTALATFAVAAVLAVSLLVVMHPNGATPKQFALAATLVVTSAFGADIVAKGHDFSGHYTVSIGTYPLTITLAALAVGGALFWRQARRYPTLMGAGLHALRTSAVFALLVTIPSVVLRGKLRFPEGVRDVNLSDVTADFHANVPAAIFLSFLYFALVSAAMLLRRRDWLPTQVAVVRDWLIAPASGLMAMVLVSCLVGLGVAAGVFFFAEHDRNTTTLVELLATLPNLGILGTLLGGGAGMTLDAKGSTKEMTNSEVGHLTHFANEWTDWVWLLTIAPALVFIVGAVWTVLRSSSAKAATNNLLVWIALTAVSVPVLAHFAGVHAHATGRDDGKRMHLDAFAGAVPWQVFLISGACAFGAAVLASALVRSRSVKPEVITQSEAVQVV